VSDPITLLGVPCKHERRSRNCVLAPGLVKGRPDTDPKGPFRGLAKRQQEQYFPHMIKDRHGTLTAPRLDNETQTKIETDQLRLSIGFTALGHRARLIAVSAPLLSNTTHAGVAAGTIPGLLPPEGTGRRKTRLFRFFGSK
jgi:hypothetical protein